MKTEPAENLLKQLQDRLAIDEDVAAAKLTSWLLSYEPGPLALARARGRIEQHDGKHGVAA